MKTAHRSILENHPLPTIPLKESRQSSAEVSSSTLSDTVPMCRTF
jgi:hypothetical protein